MALRRPRTAARSGALPSLAALLASGVVVDGCDSPAESAARLQRLTEHGERAERELEVQQSGRAALEVAVGLGLLRRPPETRIWTSGESPSVRVESPVGTRERPTPANLMPPEEAAVDAYVDAYEAVAPVAPRPRRVSPPVPEAEAEAEVQPMRHVNGAGMAVGP